MDKTYPMAFVTAPGRIEFQERKLPELRDGSVLVKVKAASICGSDLHIFKGKHPGSPLPVALGHEVAGEVVQVGKEVSRVKEGDRVALEPVISCGKCPCCRRGEYNHCPDLSRPYRKGQGSFTPYLVVDEQWTHKLPPSVSFEEGALVEPLSVAVHAIKAASVQLGHSAAIFGAGAIGLLILHLAKLSGVGETFVVDVKDFRLEKAKTIGASHAINASRQEAVDLIYETTGRLGVDRAFEAVGLEKTLVDCMKVLKQGGTGIVLGIFEEQEIRIPINIIQSREIALVGSRGYCWDFQDALKLLEAGAVKFGEIMTHTMPLSELQQAFELLMDPKKDAVKVVIQVS